MSEATPIDWPSLKARMRDTWSAGDFGQVATYTAPEAAAFVSRIGIQPGQKVLDIACGSGNQSIPAARLGAQVTGLDLVPALLEQLRAQAKAEGLTIQADEGDAERLAYADASFDVVLSMFGAMFAPRPELVAAEMLRVCRPGGTIAMANWSPAGFLGRIFAATARHVTSAAGVPSAMQWGERDIVQQRLGPGVTELRMNSRLLRFEHPWPPAETVEFYRRFYGPTQRAFAATGAGGENALRRDLTELWAKANQSQDPKMTVVDSEYLEVVAIRK